MILSIVIPVYNVEMYVEKCIRSCENQDLLDSNYEIIVVNDGSTDSSLDIVQRVAKEYPNIHVISQVNQGLSVARNVGLKISSGDFVWFIDSDDWIEPNCLLRISQYLVDDLDVLQLKFRYAYDDQALNRDDDTVYIKGVITGHQVTLNGGLPAPAQFCIYRRSFLVNKNLRFVPGLLHEDSEFKPRAVFLAQRIAMDSVVSYNYYQRTQGSITASFSMKRAMDIIYVCNSLYQFKLGLDSMYHRAFNDQIALNLNSLFLGFRNLSSLDKEKVIAVLQENKHFWHCLLNSSSLKYKLEGFCFGLNIPFALLLHKYLR